MIFIARKRKSFYAYAMFHVEHYSLIIHHHTVIYLTNTIYYYIVMICKRFCLSNLLFAYTLLRKVSPHVPIVQWIEREPPKF